MDLPLYFKMWFDRGDIFFHPKIILKKLNTWEHAQVLVVTWVNLDCVKALLSSDPSIDTQTLVEKYNMPNIKSDFIFI